MMEQIQFGSLVTGDCCLQFKTPINLSTKFQYAVQYIHILSGSTLLSAVNKQKQETVLHFLILLEQYYCGLSRIDAHTVVQVPLPCSLLK